MMDFEKAIWGSVTSVMPFAKVFTVLIKTGTSVLCTGTDMYYELFFCFS